MSCGEPGPSLLVLGLGNLVCRDDGVGIRAIQALERRYRIPHAVRLLDGGTLGLALLGWFEAGQEVLLIDAVRTELEPGSLVRLRGSDVAPAVQNRLSVHQIGVADLLDALELLGAWPRRLDLLGLVPDDLGLGVELSPAVAQNLPLLVDAIADELRARGVELEPRSEGEAHEVLDRGGHVAPCPGL